MHRDPLASAARLSGVSGCLNDNITSCKALCVVTLMAICVEVCSGLFWYPNAASLFGGLVEAKNCRCSASDSMNLSVVVAAAANSRSCRAIVGWAFAVVECSSAHGLSAAAIVRKKSSNHVIPEVCEAKQNVLRVNNFAKAVIIGG